MSRNASAVFVNGPTSPPCRTWWWLQTVTTSYRLEATNESAAVSAELTVRVNPAPVIHRFKMAELIRPGESISLSWDVSFAKTITISPAIGDVTARTVNGVGEVEAQPAVTTSYL